MAHYSVHVPGEAKISTELGFYKATNVSLMAKRAEFASKACLLICITLHRLLSQVGKQQNRIHQLQGKNAVQESELEAKSVYINDFIDHGPDGLHLN